MSIEAIGQMGASAGLSSMASLAGMAGVAGSTATASATTSAVSGGGVLFGSTLAGQVDGLQAMQANADTLAVRAVTGDLDDIHDYTIAASQATVALELTAALRNKAVEAFTEIMRMQA